MKLISVELADGTNIYVNAANIVMIGPVVEKGVPVLNRFNIITQFGSMVVKGSLLKLMEEINASA